MPRVQQNPYLAAGFEPIQIEYDCASLDIDGAMPAELDGTFYRIGPNPQFEPRGAYNPLQGDGMVHAFRISRGRVAYRNRWVRTRRWLAEREAGRALFGTSGDPADDDPSVAGVRTDGAANTNLVWHAGRLLALEEGHGPIEIDPSGLDTLGGWSFEGRLPRNMTAHPKIDPVSGEMWFFANLPRGRLDGQIALFAADAAGQIVRAETIQGPFPALIHDFALTEDFVIVPIFPVTLSLERAKAGRPAIAWEPEQGVHVAVVPRNGGAGDVRWFTAPVGMAWHVLNAFNDGGRIVLDLCVQDAPMFPATEGTPPDPSRATQRLTRWTLDWSQSAAITAERVSDLRCEYPRIDDRRTGLRHRFGYVACFGGPGSPDPFHRGVGRIDLETGEASLFDAGPACAMGEPVFAPARAGAAEGEGWVLASAFDEAKGVGGLMVFNAEAIADGPIARAHLQHRMPVGFHAQWRPAS
jgi:carotenoid cleavage dioxygenase